MKAQALIGVLAFLVGCLLVYISGYSHSNYAAIYGELTGQTLAYSLIAMLLVAATGNRKSTNTVLIIGVVFFFAAAYKSWSLYSYKKEVSDFTLTLEKFVEGEVVEPDASHSEGDSVYKLIESYLAKTQSIQLTYTKEIESYPMDLWLSPEYLTSRSKIISARNDLEEIRLLIGRTQAFLLAELDEFENVLNSRRDYESRQALKGFTESKEAGMKSTKDFFENQLNLMNVVDDILKQCYGLLGELSVQDGTLIFPDQENLDKYNTSLALVQWLANEEERITKDAIDGQQKKLNELKALQSR